MPQVRKPYTITKLRERWGEEEHQRFLEALRLHGRAWRRIEGQVHLSLCLLLHGLRSFCRLLVTEVQRVLTVCNTCRVQSTLGPKQPSRFVATPKSFSQRSVPLDFRSNSCSFSLTGVKLRLTLDQYFYWQIERDASAGRHPAQQVLADLDIPPPRPKRKPSHPYPRKAGRVSSWRPEDERTRIVAEVSNGCNPTFPLRFFSLHATTAIVAEL